jgi:uncharacterized protein YlzI (FlbEa/FlbD family)
LKDFLKFGTRLLAVCLIALVALTVVGVVEMPGCDSTQVSASTFKNETALPNPGMGNTGVNPLSSANLVRLEAMNGTVYFANSENIRTIFKSGDHTEISYIGGENTQCRDKPEDVVHRIMHPESVKIYP